MHVRVRNINDAFFQFVTKVHHEVVYVEKEETRNGPALAFDEPVMITYNNPLERVLFNPGRDCNPFFHLVEALWMLAGRNDVATPAFFAHNLTRYSDDGKTLHGAYGHRWLNHWHDEDGVPVNQLAIIIDELKREPGTRRMVLQMWDPMVDLALLTKNPKCKDVPCNTECLFRVKDGKYLEMTIINRSNDLIWGAFGANIVHFSYLQEYIALCAGLQMGPLHQISNNLHIYTNNWKPEVYMEDQNMMDYYATQPVPTCQGGDIPLVKDQTAFDVEVQKFVDVCANPDFLKIPMGFDEPFLMNVALPMVAAFHYHKARHYTAAHTALSYVKASDWRHTGRLWILKREEKYRRATEDGPNYTDH